MMWILITLFLLVLFSNEFKKKCERIILVKGLMIFVNLVEIYEANFYMGENIKFIS